MLSLIYPWTHHSFALYRSRMAQGLGTRSTLFFQKNCAAVAEQADALDLKSGGLRAVPVQIRPAAPIRSCRRSQVVWHLTFNQGIGGSIPSVCTTKLEPPLLFTGSSVW